MLEFSRIADRQDSPVKTSCARTDADERLSLFEGDQPCVQMSPSERKVDLASNNGPVQLNVPSVLWSELKALDEISVVMAERLIDGGAIGFAKKRRLGGNGTQRPELVDQPTTFRGCEFQIVQASQDGRRPVAETPVYVLGRLRQCSLHPQQLQQVGHDILVGK